MNKIFKTPSISFDVATSYDASVKVDLMIPSSIWQDPISNCNHDVVSQSCLHLTTLNLWSQDYRRHLAPMGIGSMIYEAHPTHYRYHIRVNTCTSSPYHSFWSSIYLFRKLETGVEQKSNRQADTSTWSRVRFVRWSYTFVLDCSIVFCFALFHDQAYPKRDITSNLPQSSITTHRP